MKTQGTCHENMDRCTSGEEVVEIENSRLREGAVVLDTSARGHQNDMKTSEMQL